MGERMYIRKRNLELYNKLNILVSLEDGLTTKPFY